MEQQVKAHLVFGENSTQIVEEISKHCIVSGRDYSLEQTEKWAKDAGGEDPDLFLINGRVFLQGQNEDRLRTRKAFLLIMSQIRQFRKRSRIVLLLPQSRGNDTELIAELLRMKIYDFWFMDRFDETDIQRFIFVTRTLADVEEYLQELETQGHSNRNGRGIPGRIKKIYRPYFIKSNIIAFCSHDNSLLNQGSALLTAVRLAENGFKVALVESITNIPRLAGNLSVSHPFCNTRHAISMFVQQDNDFIRDCLFNSVKYKEDGYWQEKDRHLANYPVSLFFLPDGLREDNIPFTQMRENWQAFVTELTKIIMFEKDFNFLIFCCYGEDIFTENIMKDLAYLKFISINMLPGSIAYGIKERKNGRGDIRIIGEQKISYLLEELNELGEVPFLYPPANFADDILGYIYLKNFKKISQESWRFIDRITAAIGVRQDYEEKRKGIDIGLHWLRSLLKIK